MYIGIDVHKRNAQVAVMDDAGEIVEEVRVANANLDELAQRYAGAEAVIEATSNYYHIHDTLSEHLDVTVAHPQKLSLITDSDTKTDRVDAKELARLLRLNSVPESYVPTEEIRKARALVRGRHSLVETRTEYVNKIHGLLADQGITEDVKPLSVEGREFLRELSLPAPWDSLLASHLKMIETLTEEIVASGPADDPPRSDVIDAALTHLIESHENIDEARDEHSPHVIKDIANTSVIGLNYRTSIESKWR